MPLRTVATAIVAAFVFVGCEIASTVHFVARVLLVFSPWPFAGLINKVCSKLLHRRRAVVTLRGGGSSRQAPLFEAVGVDDGRVATYIGIPYATAERFQAPETILDYAAAMPRLRRWWSHPFWWMRRVVNAAGARWSPTVANFFLAWASFRPVWIGVLSHIVFRPFFGAAWGSERLGLQLIAHVPTHVLRRHRRRSKGTAAVSGSASSSRYGDFGLPERDAGSSVLLPVIVFIHGGGYEHFSSQMPLHDCARLADVTGCVIFSIDYRLGVLGFVHFPDRTDCVSNCGVRDCCAAVEWVRHFARDFGGDPTRISVMGQSAGAMIATSLLAIPRTRNLFRNCISMSGVMHYIQTPDDARKTLDMLAKKLGLREGPDPDTPATRLARHDELYQRMRSMSLSDLMKLHDGVLDDYKLAFGKFESPSQMWLVYNPMIDGDLFGQHPIDALEKDPSLVAGRTVLTTYSANEYSFFVVLNLRGKGEPYSDHTLARRILHMVGGDLGNEVRAKEVVDAYRDTQSGWLPHALHSETGASIQAITDMVFRLPAEELASIVQSAGGKAIVCKFAEPSVFPRIGSAHAIDLHWWLGNRRVVPFFAGVWGGMAHEQRFNRLAMHMMRLVGGIAHDHGPSAASSASSTTCSPVDAAETASASARSASSRGSSNGGHSKLRSTSAAASPHSAMTVSSTASGRSAGGFSSVGEDDDDEEDDGVANTPASPLYALPPAWRGRESRGPIAVFGDPSGPADPAGAPTFRVFETTEQATEGDDVRTGAWGDLRLVSRTRTRVTEAGETTEEASSAVADVDKSSDVPARSDEATTLSG